MDTQLKNDIELARQKAKYDEQCKKLLSNKQVLAWILKYSAEEYENCTIDEIESYIEGEVQIGTVKLDAGETAESIKGLSTEDSVVNEGKITYDIRFEAVAPGEENEYIQLIVNVEAQNAFKPSYPILKRAVYYCSRMISAQKGLEFINSEYNKIKKVYSIWICPNPPKTHRSTITRYKISEENVIGNVKENKQNYDLLSIILICLGESKKNNDTVLGLLETLLSSTLKTESRIEILEKEYKMKMSKDYEGEVAEMCNLSDGVYDKGMRQGMEQGMRRGMEQGVETSELKAILSLMKTTKATAEEAMDLLMISEDKRAKYAEKLKQ